jgi:hypothetical protein
MNKKHLPPLLLAALLVFMTAGTVYAESSEYFVVGPSRDSVRTFSSADGWGYMDEEGRVIVPAAYDFTYDFINGIGCAVNEDFGIVAFNAAGESVLTFGKDTHVSYYDGRFGIAQRPTGDPYSPVRFALLDEDGNLISDYEYEYLTATGSADCHGVIHAQKDGKWGALRPDGSELIPLRFDVLQNPDPNGTVLYAMVSGGDGTAQCGYFRTDGSILADCVYEDGSPFEEGYGRLKKNGKWAVVDAGGNFVTGFDYFGLNAYSEGLAIVKGDDNPNSIKSIFGAIDTKGNLMIPYDHHYINAVAGAVSLKWNEDVSNMPYLVIENPVMQVQRIKVFVNGKWIFTDREPLIHNERTIAPIRAVCEAMSFDVEWIADTKTAVIQNEERILRIRAGEAYADLNIFDDGEPSIRVTTEAPMRIIDSRLFVPLRFIAECFGADVAWDGSTHTVTIDL